MTTRRYSAHQGINVHPGGQMWPGITSGHDSRCECTWATFGGVYQVKLRSQACPSHAGDLDAVLRRIERGRS